VPVEKIRYIGFGSIFFSEFVMLHRALGISKMVSIEKNTDEKTRFQFNRPFDCIRIEFGLSTDVLPKLLWTDPSVIWLDYTSKLSSDVVADVRLSCAQVTSPSLLLVSVNVSPGGSPSSQLDELTDAVGRAMMPVDVTPASFSGWGYADVTQRILRDGALDALIRRNGGLVPAEKLALRELCNFRYQEDSRTSRMLTWGGLISAERDAETVAKSSFEDLDFIRPDGSPCVIQVPVLTFREIRALDARLPDSVAAGAAAVGAALGLRIADVERYQSVYRFYPTFTEAEV
jgi:hypothetical protein